VEALASIVRRSASEGERESAQLIAERLREAGAADVRVEPYRYQASWASRQAPHFAAGLVAALLPGRRARAALALGALASFDAEIGGRSQWLGRLLPAGEGANVVARVPAAGERRRTLVLVAHHDAAQTGLMWRHPWLAGAGGMRRLGLGSRDEVESYAGGPELGLALVALGGRRARRVGAALLALALYGSIDVARSPTVPGASDNATGVAGVLALVERFARSPLEGTEVVALMPGSEESGMGGMAAWMRSEGSALESRATLVLGLDTLGAGEPVVLAAEGPPRRLRYREADLAWADRGAARAGLRAPRRFTIGGWTDPVLALLAGLPAISLVSVNGTGFTNYHLPTDTPDRVDWECVDRCVRLAAGVGEALGAA
jgi:acetylornithine deacetylase/succinyl-diaminopimelate desuccinylase-like protein